MVPRSVLMFTACLALALLVFAAYLSNIASLTPVEDVDAAPMDTPTPQPTPAILLGAGDITICGSDTDDQTAYTLDWLIQAYPQAQIFTVGDNVQIMGEAHEYANCFHPTWGQFKERIHPSPGNHDWFTEEGKAYFEYFGEAAGPAGLGYYSYDHGSWRMISLNSNCEQRDCSAESAQMQWLRAELLANQNRCTMVYWHHPRWDSGTVPIDPAADVFWRTAAENGADIVVNGHDHHYERFTPIDAQGNPDSQGTRPFIIGTGGAWLFELGKPLPITEARDNTTYGIMVFYLHPEQYEWAFVPVDGGKFWDTGEGECH